MFDDLKEDFYLHCARQYPNEGCGIIADDKFIPYPNISPDPEQYFQITNKAWKDHILQAVIHSHTNGNEYPSEADMKGSIESGLPWGIVPCTNGLNKEIFWFGEGVPTEKLIGRGFRHGVTDCYSLIRDWYLENAHIKLPDFIRGWEWWKNGKDLYLESYSKAGFEEVINEPLERGDLLLFKVRSKVINHAAVYLGDDLILHHPSSDKGYDPSKLSIREPVNRWIKFLQKTLRH